MCLGDEWKGLSLRFTDSYGNEVSPTAVRVTPRMDPPSFELLCPSLSATSGGGGVGGGGGEGDGVEAASQEAPLSLASFGTSLQDKVWSPAERAGETEDGDADNDGEGGKGGDGEGGGGNGSGGSGGSRDITVGPLVLVSQAEGVLGINSPGELRVTMTLDISVDTDGGHSSQPSLLLASQSSSLHTLTQRVSVNVCPGRARKVLVLSRGIGALGAPTRRKKRRVGGAGGNGNDASLSSIAHDNEEDGEEEGEDDEDEAVFRFKDLGVVENGSTVEGPIEIGLTDAFGNRTWVGSQGGATGGAGGGTGGGDEDVEGKGKKGRGKKGGRGKGRGAAGKKGACCVARLTSRAFGADPVLCKFTDSQRAIFDSVLVCAPPAAGMGGAANAEHVGRGEDGAGEGGGDSSRLNRFFDVTVEVRGDEGDERWEMRDGR